MRFVSRAEVESVFAGKRVVIVGSGPGVLDNPPGEIDSHDVVVRVNNYKNGRRAGSRTDVFYSFFGGSILKTQRQLKSDGVRLCMCKCPNSKPLESAWHVANNKLNGVDFRYIYRDRVDWWFCDTYVPGDAEFLAQFETLGRHIPTTGFAAILTVISFEPTSLFLTGFDFFTSGVHNVDEKWKPGRPDDPIGHAPARELQHLRVLCEEHHITTDPRLRRLLHP